MVKDNKILNNVLNEELERLNKIAIVYKNELSALPKGKVMYKKIKGKNYSYLQYRAGSKIKSEYIGNNDKLNEIEKQIARRKEIEQAIKRVEHERKQLEHVVNSLNTKRKGVKNGNKILGLMK